jgi:hypothetical protein
MNLIIVKNFCTRENIFIEDMMINEIVVGDIPIIVFLDLKILLNDIILFSVVTIINLNQIIISNNK